MKASGPQACRRGAALPCRLSVPLSPNRWCVTGAGHVSKHRIPKAPLAGDASSYFGVAQHAVALGRRDGPGRGCSVRCLAASSAAVSVGDQPKTSDNEIRWGSFISRQESLEAAVAEATGSILAGMGPGARPTLALVFVSEGHEDEFERVVPLLRRDVPSLQHVFGCSSYGIVGGGGGDGPGELEGLVPGFSLTLGQLPGVEMKVLHTLRSSIPKEDDPPEAWAEFVGVPHTTDKNVSFVLLADPRFQQIRNIVAGLDYAFRKAPKIGGVLSSGPEARTPTMFAWSADGLVNAGPLVVSGQTPRGGSSRLARRRQRERLVAAASSSGPQQEEGQEEDALDSPLSSSSPPLASSPSTSPSTSSTPAPQPNFWQSMANAVVRWAVNTIGGDAETATGDSRQRQDSVTASSSSERDAGEDSGTSGTYLLGAVALVLHGDVVIETVVATGYRCFNSKMYRVEQVEDRHIMAIMREPSPYVSSSSSNSGSSSSSPGSSSSSSNTAGGLLPPRRMSQNDDDDSDDEDDEDEDEEGRDPLPAIAALVELLDAFRDEPIPRAEWEELLESTRVAVSDATDKQWNELERGDFKLLNLVKAFEETGVLLVDHPVLRGDRMCMMVKDALGCRDDLQGGLLTYKRKDLQAMLSGRTLPRTFGVLMFSDVDHCDEYYESIRPPAATATSGASSQSFGGTAGAVPPFSEAQAVAGYLPVPISGMFGGAQVAREQGSPLTSLLEESCVVGVLRATGPTPSPAQEVSRTEGAGSTDDVGST